MNIQSRALPVRYTDYYNGRDELFQETRGHKIDFPFVKKEDRGSEEESGTGEGNGSGIGKKKWKWRRKWK